MIPGIDNPSAPSDEVINLSDVIESTNGGDKAAVADKKDLPEPRDASSGCLFYTSRCV